MHCSLPCCYRIHEEKSMFVTEKEIKNRLSEIRNTHPQLYCLLLEKIEFKKILRFKKTIKQSMRKIFAMGIKEYARNLLGNRIIAQIRRPSDKKKIIFLAGLTFNSVGMSIYLRKTGNYETILLIESPWLCGFFRKYFDRVYVYNSYYEVARILSLIRPYLVHVHGSSGYYFLGVIAQCLNDRGAIVAFVDPPSFECGADDTSELYKKSKETQRDCFSEEFIFHKSNGIILTASNLAAGEKLRRRYNSNKPMLEFPPYVCAEFFGEQSKYSQKNNAYYLVYGGLVAPSNKPKEILGYIQFIDLAKSLTNQGFHFHIYISPHYSPLQVRKLFSDYLCLAAERPAFAFKQGIPLDTVTREFSRYDFAVIINQFKGVSEKKVNMFHWHTSIPSKFFTYLSAGLPVIVSEENDCIAKLIRKYEIGIVIDQSEIDSLAEIIKGYDYEKMKANVRRAREELSMKRHIDRLIGFYEKAHGNGRKHDE